MENFEPGDVHDDGVAPPGAADASLRGTGGVNAPGEIGSAERREPPVPPDPVQEASLAPMRARIDEIDASIVAALAERARIVTDIGRMKRGGRYPIYAPHREREVLARILSLDRGPLPARTLEAIWRELMSGSFALELPLRVAYLGPPGSFSHLAAVRQFGSSVEHDPLRDIQDVFTQVERGHCHYGIVPYENSIGGGVTDTLDAFQQCEVAIYAEVLVEVRQNLLSNAPAESITRILSKPQIFSQCRQWLARMYPGAELVPATSSSEAVRLAATAPGAAAIGSLLAGEIHGVHALYEHIEDRPGNITRFLVIAKEEAEPTGDDRTSIMFVTSHEPGALVDVLAVFRDRGINLSHIEKRPSGTSNWQYIFFIDCEGHRRGDALSAAVHEASAHCTSIRVLGSYPRALRVM